MTIFQVLVLAVIQGACELLPVSSSAHVIVAEKLMRLDPTAPEMTFLLVMLHTGTMFAVIVYFWTAWRNRYFASARVFWGAAKLIALATALTGVVGLTLMLLIERVVLRGSAHAEVESLFGNSYLIAAGLAAVGLMIILSGRQETISREEAAPGRVGAAWIGVVQGLCLPFRGFSRSGATISTGLFLRLDRTRVEEFSFALAVVLTPAVIAREGYRLLRADTGVRHECRKPLPLGAAKLARHGLQFPGGSRGASVALALAGTRPVALVRLLLSGCGCRRTGDRNVTATACRA